MRTSRELSERVEIDFYRHPRRFRRLTWGTAAVLGIVSAAWLVVQSVQGRGRIYQAGPLATPHRLFENDCEKCHTTWTPLLRLTSLTTSSPVGTSLSSVTNEKCMACHTGPAHHDNQVPAHQDISCATCHREHEGDQALAWIADRHCIDCHADLKTTHGPSRTFVRTITRFEESGGGWPGSKRSEASSRAGAPATGRGPSTPATPGTHPEFAVYRLLKSASPQTDIGREHEVFSVLGYFRRENEDTARWQDKARIRFNHKAHLKPDLPAGRDEHGAVRRETLQCRRCHQPDAERRYMQPIHYETHCAECHPLYFDVSSSQALRGNQTSPMVPHEAPEIVRGYLTDFYTLRALEQTGEGEAVPRSEPLRLPARKLPGRRYRDLLTVQQADWLKTQLQRAEQQVLKHTHTLFGYEAQGGCRYCHTVTEPLSPHTPLPQGEGPGVREPSPPGEAGGVGWHIEPPNIPDRWLKHSRFRHDSHRMLACTQCHRDFINDRSVSECISTGDVLLPTIEQCLACHAGKPRSADSNSSLGSARNRCVECHNYHNYQNEDFNGPLNTRLNRIAGQPDNATVMESTK